MAPSFLRWTFRPGAPVLVAGGLLVMLLAAPSARAATFRVGDDAACTHGTVQAAINAAQSALEPSVIRVSRSAAYVQQGLVANINRNLELTGGYANCAQAVADGTMTTLDGAGGATASVLRIIAGTAVTVIVRKLQIQGGDPAGENAGGGIFFGGNGTLEVHDSTVINNIAGNGGGIYAGSAVPGAQLIIGANVAISGNEARFSGGGVFVDGLEMTMVEPDSIIANNTALGTSSTGYGGGLFIRGLTDRPGIAIVGSGGRNELGTIFGNVARAGGGVSVGTPSFEGFAKLVLFSTVAGQPTAIRNNQATVAGGGLFVQSRRVAGSLFVEAVADLWKAEITDNEAPSGAAVYLANTSGTPGDTPFGGRLFVNLSAPSGALPCYPGIACGAISGNRAREPGGQATDGAVIQLQQTAVARIGSAQAGISLSGNQGGRLIDVQPAGGATSEGGATVRNALVADNQLSVHLLRAQHSPIAILDSTIAGNLVGSGDVLAINADLEFRRSILWQPGMTSLSQSGGTRAVSSVIASETISLGGAPLAIIAPPRFIDPARGDYRLRAASPAVDFAPVAGGRDISGELRDQDLPLKPDAEGPRDIGAYERHSIGDLVLNRTFDVPANLNQWSVVTPGSTTWDGSQDAGGVNPSGSAKVAGTPNQGMRLVGAKQCIHLPGPGRYKLNGYGMTTFAVGAQRDSVILHWDLRHDGGESCEAGAVAASGDHLLTRGTSFDTPVQPAVIDVPGEVWTTNSSITVALVMVDNGIAFPAQVTGWFDGITLTGEPLSDVIFADGFE